ncbi:hypothetical protein [Kitasatospora purpeofusca]|uniref:hypothetical protein n=1 Tax=Kitasatospora purpeofusca TaxID=67352 RepID=UPI002A5A3004|nr:hypothetical protein [Kitasatospora purpeofusca]MDY0810720.1 hypothetical protein [Kitasatospora purpeofusca]
MALRFVGIDPETGKDQSPTVWVDDESGELVVQSYAADRTLIGKVLEAGHGPDHANSIPDNEAVIRIPRRMVPILRKACDAAEGSELL